MGIFFFASLSTLHVFEMFYNERFEKLNPFSNPHCWQCKGIRDRLEAWIIIRCLRAWWLHNSRKCWSLLFGLKYVYMWLYVYVYIYVYTYYLYIICLNMLYKYRLKWHILYTILAAHIEIFKNLTFLIMFLRLIRIIRWSFINTNWWYML